MPRDWPPHMPRAGQRQPTWLPTKRRQLRLEPRRRDLHWLPTKWQQLRLWQRRRDLHWLAGAATPTRHLHSRFVQEYLISRDWWCRYFSIAVGVSNAPGDCNTETKSVTSCPAGQSPSSSVLGHVPRRRRWPVLGHPMQHEDHRARTRCSASAGIKVSYTCVLAPNGAQRVSLY